jgi:SEC-C motif
MPRFQQFHGKGNFKSGPPFLWKRAAILAVDALEKALNAALKVIDDIGSTTKAPKMASFDYWRNLIAKRGSAPCPCRSGRKAKHCLHRWTDPAPTIVERFDIGAR